MVSKWPQKLARTSFQSVRDEIISVASMFPEENPNLEIFKAFGLGAVNIGERKSVND